MIDLVLRLINISKSTKNRECATILGPNLSNYLMLAFISPMKNHLSFFTLLLPETYKSFTKLIKKYLSSLTNHLKSDSKKKNRPSLIKTSKRYVKKTSINLSNKTFREILTYKLPWTPIHFNIFKGNPSNPKQFSWKWRLSNLYKKQISRNHLYWLIKKWGVKLLLTI